MTNFVCINCGYRFETEEKPKMCPYCAETGLEEEKSAEDLVSDVKIE